MAANSAVSSTHGEENENKLQIVLVGTSGSGRSATGNTIIGSKPFKSSPSDQSVTIKWQKETMTIFSTKITVIDTPGCHCTKLSHGEVIKNLKELTNSLELPFAFLLVVPAGDFTPKESATVSMLQEALGDSYLSHTVIAFSHSDDLELKDITQKEFIQGGNKELQDLIGKCDSRHHFVNNRKAMGKEDLEKLVSDLQNVAKKNKDKLMPYQQRPEETERAREESNVSVIELCANTCFMVLGIKGVGKTASIRTILPGAKHTEHDGCSVYSNGQMNLVECPGFDEDHDEIIKAIQRGLDECLRVCEQGPHIILIVMKVGRFSPATKKTMQQVQTILLEKATQTPVIILFTGKADLEGKSIWTFIHESEDLVKFVSMFGLNYFALENRENDTQSQAMELLNMSVKLLKNKTLTESERQKNSVMPGHSTALATQGSPTGDTHDGVAECDGFQASGQD